MRPISDEAKRPPLGSAEWVTAAQRAVAKLRVSRSMSLRARCIIDDDSQQVAWWLDIANGEVRVGTETERPDDSANEPVRTVTFTMTRAVAEQVRAGQLGALDAVQAGAITVTGDTDALVGANEAFSAISRVLATAQND